jgi:hypothetical protein
MNTIETCATEPALRVGVRTAMHRLDWLLFVIAIVVYSAIGIAAITVMAVFG